MARWFGLWFNAALTAQGLTFAYWCAVHDEAAEILKEQQS